MVEYVNKQLSNIFPNGDYKQRKSLVNVMDEALTRTYRCLSRTNNKYYTDGFDYTNGDQYAIFLYYLSNTLFKRGSELATTVYLLNKALHGIDLFYEVEMPEVFLVVHPVGTVLGRATYSDGLRVYQNVNIGSNDGKYPLIGENFTAHPGASILGDCKIGKNCAVGAGSLLLDKDLPDGATYVGNPLVYKVVMS